MRVDGKAISSFLKKEIKKKIKENNLSNLKLVVIVVDNKTHDQSTFVKAKEKQAKSLGIEFELIDIKRVPLFEKFVRLLQKIANKKSNTAIIIQQPLPNGLSTKTIYKFIPLVKEIEGHLKKTVFMPPIGQAVITILKYIYITKGEVDERLLLDVENDKHTFKTLLKNKNVVLIGRGITGGLPIGKTLTQFKINHLNINSKTSNVDRYLKSADIIISAVGKKVIEASKLKKGVNLINVGVRKENGKLRGDYDEEEIKDIAGFYTPTPGGIGPIDVSFLFNNLVKSAIIQQKKNR